MTWPLTFSSPPFDWYLAKEEAKGECVAEKREKDEVARGSWNDILVFAAV